MGETTFQDVLRGIARGSLILIAGQLITGIISTVTIIWLARVLGPTNYGDYTLALLPVSIALLFQDLGMNLSLTRFSSMYRYEKRENLKTVVWTGFIFSFINSLLISGILFVFSSQIATYLLFRPELETLVKVAAFAVLGNGGVQSTLGAIFVGYELMGLKSILLILFSVLRGIIGVALVFLGFSTFGAVFSYSAALLLSSFIGLLLFLKYIKFEKTENSYFDFATLKMLIKFGLPLSLSAIFDGALSQLYNYLLAFYVATDLIGNYGATLNFGVIITFFTIPIKNSLLPLFSKFKLMDPKLNTIFQFSVKYTAMITLPIALLITALSYPISNLVYGDNYSYVPLYLSLYLLSFIFEGLGGITLANLILGIGETRPILYTSLISLLVGGPLAVVLISHYQVVGLLMTMIIAPRFGWIYQILWAKRNANIMINVKTVAYVYLSGFIAFLLTYILINYLYLGTWLSIIIGGPLFVTTYLLCLLATGSIKKVDLIEIAEATKFLGPFSKIIQKFLSFVERFARN